MIKRIYYDEKDNTTTPLSNNTLSKTESLTCRLDKILLNKLRSESEQKEISVNTLINQILRNHSDWHSNAAKAGFIPIRRSLIMKLMEKVSEEEMVDIAESLIKKDTKDIHLMLRNQYTIESAIDLIETWIRIAGYPYRHEVDYERHNYAIKHEMGNKWSLYLKALFAFIFEEFGLGRVIFEVRDNTLSFTVDTRSLI